jgi:hypothetical protein
MTTISTDSRPVIEIDGERIREDGSGFRKRYAVLPEVGGSLVRVPFEVALDDCWHRMHYHGI